MDKTTTAAPEESSPKPDRRKLGLSLAALGIVYGDIGTSPLYAFRQSFRGDVPLAVTEAHILGVLSMIVWSLIIVISIKYLHVVMRVSNKGEGGIVALASLFNPKTAKVGTGRFLLISLGLFGASLLYGDGTITPAISVLSALEGLEIATTAFKPFIVPAAVLILIGLFAIQSRGTAKIGRLFGPVMLVWFFALGLLGAVGIFNEPAVLKAISPSWALEFMAREPHLAFLVLGAVFLAVTGGETLYADMGHFGPGPIRLAWFGLVLPCLVLNYFGQGALVLSNFGEITHPFFHLAPGWALYPLVALSTLATIIASQAVISGVFSLTRQAINLGQLPRLQVIQTSNAEFGQIYVPAVNWILMIVTIALVVAFRSSSSLASAYGVAISTDMMITTLLIMALAVRWRKSLFLVVAMGIIFLPVDIAFWLSSMTKVPQGGWYPIVAGALIFFLMPTWRKGQSIQLEQLLDKQPDVEDVPTLLAHSEITRPEGIAVFFTRSGGNYAPAALHHMIERLHSVPKTIILLQVGIEHEPHVPASERLTVELIAPDVYAMKVKYGFVQPINVPIALSLATRQGLPIEIDDMTYVLMKETIVPSDPHVGMAKWRNSIYSFLHRNADRPSSYFHIPPERTIEIGIHVEV